ncbi:hypothetical protein VFPPC_03790 [Pochonia chlamydosporia 170]|uniref:Uncharacterized protein n=1 Tax=Pochonia chlamydosporia 170 TaxID=1380566 RepID=A0A179F2L6_METCM|nr:hypothetical protein VFPPC_03790 [Pochonia chlamydosporia 170]OAQ59560.1 hypothetical protein VFPPC_03790 [Pochonia chlamydosporia 170]
MGSVAQIMFYPPKSNAVDSSKALEGAAQVLSRVPGAKAAYHGVLVEDEEIHCSAGAAFKETVNMEHGVEPFLGFATFKHDTAEALTANVTEFRFYSLPDKNATEEVVMQKIIGNAKVDEQPAVTVGKAKGVSMGYMWWLKPDLADMGSTTCFSGIFGYDSVEDYWRWKDMPEHVEAIKGTKGFMNELGMKPVDMFGKRRAMFEGSGIIHVKFKKTF